MKSLTPDLGLELWLAQKICSPNLQTVFDGVTDVAERCKRVRELIAKLGIADAPAGGVKRGSPKSFRECFEKIYQEPLDPRLL